MPQRLDPARVARRLTLIGEDYAYATYWNLRGMVDRRPPEDYLSGDLPPVIAVPGVYEDWRFLTPLIDAIHEKGHPVHAFPALGRNRRPIIETARVVGQYLREHDLRDVSIVAHSKGGLVGKYTMLRLDPDQRVTRMIAICSPFVGTRMARFALTPELRVFAPTSPVTQGLNRYVDINARITSIYSRFDPHIPEGSELRGARNIRLAVDGHFQILADPGLIRTVLSELGDA